MERASYSYRAAQGWSAPFDARLDSDATLVLIFGAPSFLRDSKPLADLAAAFPRAHLLGCSTAGEIHGSEILDDSLAVAVARFSSTRVRSACENVEGSGDSFRAGERIARALLAKDLRAILVLSEGLGVNGSELVRGLNAALPERVVVTGGLAGDGDRFRETWILRDRIPAAHGVSAVGLYGDRIRVGHGSKGGWDIFGPERVVTRSEGNVLFELDGRPALDLYRQYLGDRAAGLPATGLLFPLSLRADRESTKTLVRTILAVDDAAQSLTFAGDIPTGYLAQLMKANFDRLVQGAEEAAQIAGARAKGIPELVVAISCVGRRLVLGERAEEETEAVLEAFPPGSTQVGFYSYGEISPYANGPCDLHNQTMTLTTIREEA